MPKKIPPSSVEALKICVRPRTILHHLLPWPRQREKSCLAAIVVLKANPSARAYRAYWRNKCWRILAASPPPPIPRSFSLPPPANGQLMPRSRHLSALLLLFRDASVQ